MALKPMKRTRRRGRTLLAAGAGVITAASALGCGVQIPYGVRCQVDGGPCEATDSGAQDSGPFGIIVNPDGGDGG